MSLDVVDFRTFYAQPLGTVARRLVSRGIRMRWSDTRAQRIAGIGYATPYLGLFREEAERCLAFMPAAQGVVKWPSKLPTLTALVEELDLPPIDAAVDRVLLVHALEMSQDAQAMLRAVWRDAGAGGGWPPRRLIGRFRRGGNGGGWCRRSNPCWRHRPAERPPLSPSPRPRRSDLRRPAARRHAGRDDGGGGDAAESGRAGHHFRSRSGRSAVRAVAPRRW